MAAPMKLPLDLANTMLELHPTEAAQTLDMCNRDDVAELLEKQPPRRAAQVLQRMTQHVAADCIGVISQRAFREIVTAGDLAKFSTIIRRLSPETRAAQLASLDETLAKDIGALVEYPPNTAGSHMDPDIYTFRPSTTVKDVISKLRTLRRQRMRNILVTDGDDKLIGQIPLQSIVMAEPKQRLDELIVSPPVSVQPMTNQEEVADLVAKQRLDTLPITDFDGHILGVIRSDELAQAVQEAVSSDMQAMFGASREERALSPAIFAVKKRLPWLNINLLTAFLAAAVVGLFEKTIAQFTALAVLLPVVAGQSGNTGAQALAVTMRGLALREVRTRDWLRLVLKEAQAGAMNGAAVAVVTAAGVFVWSRSPGLCLVIGVSMVISMAIAGVAGAIIPILLTKLGQDPAQSSSIILTTVTDVMGFLSFLGLATLLSGIL